ncbi:Plexin-A4 [Geodia barretti]|uniref:Plexin-A4 n=1 Tax=Geodia barretti TaxID=519541 RepID=A0AA35SZQ8_GEOBA|nr:Plexin-A4 [Geodia barretti]
MYPLETCSESATCGECTGEDSFPLCGWCTVEDKCSRRSQCLDSSQPGRWVQSSSECISTSVSPAQFILDSPTILNVTATSPLPGNLTYNCSFSAPGEKFPLVVPAIEVVAGTQYQCNITNVATSLDSVKQVTHFSFVSVEVGVPFATSQNALTIYNCSAAKSCVECLDTEGACGWCLYGGICSRISEPCPVPEGVNNSYLTLGTSSGPTEVCPVVNSAPTTGNYTQPVNVARDLVLQTSNLPSLVLQISSGDQTVSLELIWTNDAVSYPLNGNSPDRIKCILYDCNELETSCSSCLGRNEAGFTCGWCSDECSVMEECSKDFSTTTIMCPRPRIDSVQPNRGPTAGGTRVSISGTDLGASYDDIRNVTLQLGGVDVNCTLSGEDTYDVGRRITCETQAAYSYEEPRVTGVDPAFGPKSGGIEVVISGSSLSIGNRDDTAVTLGDNNCAITYINDSMIICKSGGFQGNNISEAVLAAVVVMIDDADVSREGVGFDFKEDPIFIGVSPQRVIPANPDLTNISYAVRFGDAPGPNRTRAELTLESRPDPVFPEDGTALSQTEFSPGSGAPLTISGMFIDSVENGEIRVTVGGEECEARISGDNDPNSYTCFVPRDPPNGMNTAPVVLKVVARSVFLGNGWSEPEVRGWDSDVHRGEETATPLAIIIGASCGGGVLILLILVMFCVICCVTRRATAREKKFTNLLAQMELWESEMADECKRAFTELQTDLADLVQISDDKNLPYRDFRSFAMRFLFPSAGADHPVLNPLPVADSQEMVPHLKAFHQLILDKKFLLLFVRTLEAQQGRFTLQDKCNVASLLMVAFQNNLDYATEILQTLLKDVMHQAVLKSHPKLLLRRTETVAEKMLANWLCFLLFPYLLEHAGEPLFILFRAIKSQLEKGPVDVITGEARHSLSEEKLLRQKYECQVVDSVVETDGGEQISVKLLDCDTITQAKEKILDALYKNTAISCRPQLLDVDLELRRSHAGIPLRDHDSTNVKEGDWIKINTLGHYRLAEMSQAAADNPKLPVPSFRLVARQERPVSGMSFDHVGTIIANLNSSAAVTSGPQRILQPYVDDLFKGIFAVPRGKPLAKAIKFLYDFLDLQAAELGIQDPEILHTWKTNSLFLRFWVSLIKNPDFVFDIHKSATVDACLTIIAQAYIDACSTSEMKYNKNTPSAKLLYVNEVRSYKQEVQQYYSTVQSLPKLSSHDMSEYLRETAQVCSKSVQESTEHDIKHVFMTRKLYFVTESALYELFKFAATYSSELQDALNDEGLSVMAIKLEQLQAAIKV